MKTIISAIIGLCLSCCAAQGIAKSKLIYVVDITPTAIWTVDPSKITKKGDIYTATVDSYQKNDDNYKHEYEKAEISCTNNSVFAVENNGKSIDPTEIKEPKDYKMRILWTACKNGDNVPFLKVSEEFTAEELIRSHLSYAAIVEVIDTEMSKRLKGNR